MAASGAVTPPRCHTPTTNPTNGKSFTDSDIGLDKRVFNPDGTSDVLSTGIHFKGKSPDGGIIFRRIGLQIIHLDENGDVTSIDIVGGNFDLSEEIDAAVCRALA